ncbi:MAG: KOW domain-containing RNA-binding protein [Eubacteriales bacterium]|jgi:hypothetical protein|nr:KOW domain-containing RNA-binding protein [Eubacteriales bacterium]
MVRLKDSLIGPGMIVSSKAGHDKHRLYLVVRTEDERVWLTDGRYRTVDNLKIKNMRHVRLLDLSQHCDVLQDLATLNDSGQKNALIRRVLAQYNRPLEIDYREDVRCQKKT